MRMKLLILVLLAVGVYAHDAKGKSHAPASAKTLKSPLTAEQAKPALGKANFEKTCAGCHNPKSKAPDLTGHHMHSLKDGEVYWVITNGIGKTMPGFKTQLSDVERWQIVLYVRGLQK